MRLPQFGAQLIRPGLFLLALLPFVLPRGATSRILPLPAVEQELVLEEFAKDKRRATQAAQSPLRPDIRAVGELFRREQQATLTQRLALQKELLQVVKENLLLGRAEDLAQLRALQSSIFYHALVSPREETSKQKHLDELAAGFEEPENSFRSRDGELQLNALQLNLLFKFRWSQITGTLHTPGLEPSPDEVRAYYRLLLLKPPGFAQLSPPEVQQKQLALSRSLGRQDPDYPAQLTAGILLYQLGSRELGTSATAAYLSRSPEGPWGLIAKTQLQQGLFELRGQF